MTTIDYQQCFVQIYDELFTGSIWLIHHDVFIKFGVIIKHTCPVSYVVGQNTSLHCFEVSFKTTVTPGPQKVLDMDTNMVGGLLAQHTHDSKLHNTQDKCILP